MTSTISSVFSTTTSSESDKPVIKFNLYELISHDSLSNSNTKPILTSALNSCYRTALHSLHEYLEKIDGTLLTSSSSSTTSSTLIIDEDTFEFSAFSDRVYSPSSVTISQWRHEALSNNRFLTLLFELVTDSMISIVLNWIDIELENEQSRQSKSDKKKNDLINKRRELQQTPNTITSKRLQQLSDIPNEVLFEKVDWKLISTRMRSDGGFKYFDENVLRRIWIQRCQYGVDDIWTPDEDKVLDDLVQELGLGQWTVICENPVFQRSQKSAYMCAQRYMSRSNEKYSERSFPKSEKDELLSIYKNRSTVMKDYRFCTSYAAYVLGDRTIQKINRIWTYMNPDVQRGPFSPEEDAILIREASRERSICWATLAAKYLPDRSAVRCRQRYFHITRPPANRRKERKKTKTNKPSQIALEDTNNSANETTMATGNFVL